MHRFMSTRKCVPTAISLLPQLQSNIGIAEGSGQWPLAGGLSVPAPAIIKKEAGRNMTGEGEGGCLEANVKMSCA